MIEVWLAVILAVAIFTTFKWFRQEAERKRRNRSTPIVIRQIIWWE